MNHQTYFNYIEDCLCHLASRLKIRGSLNLLDLHIHSENFYLGLLNRIYGWKLRNLNSIKKNSPGIDLVDDAKKIVVQVSATNTRDKINSSLSKVPPEYKGYLYKFLSISEDASDLRKNNKKYINPQSLVFEPDNDIYDIKTILSDINSMDINQVYLIKCYLDENFRKEIDKDEVTTNLAGLVELLSEEDLDPDGDEFKKIPYDIQSKIDYNKLDISSMIIHENKIYYHRLDEIYACFNKQGKNKSASVFHSLKKTYLQCLLETKTDDNDKIFFRLLDVVEEKAKNSSNYHSMPEEELALYVSIVVVDAFIRCKVFKNPPQGN